MRANIWADWGPIWVKNGEKRLFSRFLTSPKNNLNKVLDNEQRNSEIKDLAEKSKSDLLGLIKLRKENPNDPNIAYLNINSLREKITSPREISLKSSVDILCVDEAKLDASYPNVQFILRDTNFHHFVEIEINMVEEKWYLYETV